MVEQEQLHSKIDKKGIREAAKLGRQFADQARRLKIHTSLGLTAEETYLFGLCLASWSAKDANYHAVRSFNDPEATALSSMPIIGFVGKLRREAANQKIAKSEALSSNIDKLKTVLLSEKSVDEKFKTRSHTVQLAANNATPFFFDLVDHNDRSIGQNGSGELDDWCKRWKNQLAEAEARNLEPNDDTFVL